MWIERILRDSGGVVLERSSVAVRNKTATSRRVGMIGGRLWIDSWAAAAAFRRYVWILYMGVLSVMSVFLS
jgi:hypothetical protein